MKRNYQVLKAYKREIDIRPKVIKSKKIYSRKIKHNKGLK